MRKRSQDVVCANERLDGDPLVRMVGESGVPGAEVHGVETARREVRDVRPCLLRATTRSPAAWSARTDGRVGDDARRRRIADDLEGRAVRDEAREVLLRLGRLAVRRVAEVERRRRLAGNDVVGDPGVEPCDGDDLAELEPSDHRDPWIELEQRDEAVAPHARGRCRRATGAPNGRSSRGTRVARRRCRGTPTGARGRSARARRRASSRG